jgi:arylsulfatase A-like enzyme
VFAGLPLPTPPSFNEANVSDKPREVADLPRLSSERIAAIRENYQQRLESLLAVDEGVEEMYDALVRSGELDNTLIVFTSDNGFFHGEHRIAAGKAYPYEAALRVPLVLRGPGVPHGRSLPQIVANIDLAPTILEAAGALPGRVQDGISLFTLMRDPGRELGRDLLLENGHGAGGVGALKAIRTYRYFYAEHRTTGEHELYDLARDPWELRNLDHDAGYDGVERELARRLHRLQHCRGAGCRARPRLHLLVHLGARHARGGRCPSGKVRVRVGGADRRRLVRADFLVGQRRIARRAHGPFASTLPLAGGPRRVRLRVRAVLRDGRVLTLDRRLVACRG